jgi:hypothetical protein
MEEPYRFYHDEVYPINYKLKIFYKFVPYNFGIQQFELVFQASISITHRGH